MTSVRTGERLRLLRRAKPGDVVQAFAALWAAARAEWGLRRRTLPATAASLGLRFEPTLEDEARPVTPEARVTIPPWAWRRAHIAQLVVSVWPFGNTCLRRALVMGNRLSAFGPELVLGVRPNDGATRFDAHAWVRIRGVDLDPMARNYLILGDS